MSERRSSRHVHTKFKEKKMKDHDNNDISYDELERTLMATLIAVGGEIRLLRGSIDNPAQGGPPLKIITYVDLRNELIYKVVPHDICEFTDCPNPQMGGEVLVEVSDGKGGLIKKVPCEEHYRLIVGAN